jgi:hypothetical protein
MQISYRNRVFQLWEYKVTHGSLLIRSPQSPEISTNIDLVCVGVEYLALPRHIRGLDLAEPSGEEVRQLSELLGRPIEASRIRMILSGGQRFPVVAASFRVSENDDDIFASTFPFPRTPNASESRGQT